MASKEAVRFDQANVSEEHKFSLCNPDPDFKNNKYWNIYLMNDGRVLVNYGPQGKPGQWHDYGAGGKHEMDRLIRKKTSESHDGGAYCENMTVGKSTPAANTARGTTVVVKEHVRTRAVAEIAKGNPILTDLVGYLTDVNRHQISDWSGGAITYNDTTGLFQTTQGVISLGQIHEARRVLNEVADFAARRVFDSKEFFAKAGRYLSLVPQEGLIRKMDWSRMFGTGPGGGLAHQGDILDSLEASYASAMAMPTPSPTDKKKPAEPALFKVELEMVAQGGEEFCHVRNFYNATRKSMHGDVAHLEVKRVFTLRIEAMALAFLKRGVKMGGIMQLWHGTMPSNLLSILKGGMCVPPSSSPHVCGRLFGDGLYFSDQSTKSIRYATGAWSGQHVDRVFMLLNDVAMGENIYYPTSSISRLPAGYTSCFARGEQVKSGGRTLLNNEMIVYNTYQANPVFLAEFSDRGR